MYMTDYTNGKDVLIAKYMTNYTNGKDYASYKVHDKLHKL